MKGKAVLVVEDDLLNRLDAVCILLEAGLDVLEADCVEAALAILWDQSAAIAAVFTDVKLPGHSDGFDLVGLIGRHWPKIVVLVTSGIVSEPAHLPINVRFFPKPWRPADVLPLLREAINAFEVRAENRWQGLQPFSGMMPPQ